MPQANTLKNLKNGKSTTKLIKKISIIKPNRKKSTMTIDEKMYLRFKK